MNKMFFKLSILLLNLILFFSCGIKRDPKPLSQPEYKLLRIGDTVFLIPKNRHIIPEGFQKKGNFFFRREPSAFCFRVKHVKGREELACVKASPGQRLKASIRDEGEKLLVAFEEEATYRVRPFREGVVPQLLSEVRGSVLHLEKRYEPYTVAVTRVLRGVESEPLVVHVPPKEPPVPPSPEGLRFVVKGDRLYLYWWFSSEDVVGFIVLKNGKALTSEPQIQNVFIDDLPSEETVYEVVSVNRFGKRSKPARVVYRP